MPLQLARETGKEEGFLSWRHGRKWSRASAPGGAAIIIVILFPTRRTDHFTYMDN